MSLKDIQIFNHQHYRLIRNICLGVILIALFIVPGVLQIQRLDHQTTQIKNLNEQVKALTQRNIDLSKQNIALNQRNINHTDCIATVFAQFTHDNVPVSFKDLDSCSITTGISGGTSVKTSDSSVNRLGSSPNTSTSSKPAQSNTSPSTGNGSDTPPPKAKPTLLQRIISDINPLN